MENLSLDEDLLYVPDKNLSINWDHVDYTIPVPCADIDAQYRIRYDWFLRLKALSENIDTISPDQADLFTRQHALNEKQIEYFTQFLINSQIQNYENNMYIGAWAIPDCVETESDARVDFIYFPTYIAVSWLCLVKQRYPQISHRLEGFDDCLKKGLDASTNRDLSGHGYDSDRELLQAIIILGIGDVFRFVKKHQIYSLKFMRTISRVNRRLMEIEECNEGWGAVDMADLNKAMVVIKN